jgi:hypothetical protein
VAALLQFHMIRRAELQRRIAATTDPQLRDQLGEALTQCASQLD